MALSFRGLELWPPGFVASSGEALEKLLAELHAVRERLPVLHLPASAFVETVGGVDEIAVVREKPLDSVRASALFVRGQGHDEVAVGNVDPRRFMRIRFAIQIAAIALSSEVPRP